MANVAGVDRLYEVKVLVSSIKKNDQVTCVEHEYPLLNFL